MLNRAAFSNLGSHVYGLASVALGLIGLVWGDFASVWQPVPESIPHRRILAYIVAVLLLVGGTAMQWRTTARAGIVILTTLYLMAALLWAPRVVALPRMIGTWLGFAEEFALVAAGSVAYASLRSHDASWTRRTARTGCFLFGLCAITFGLAHFLALRETAGMVPKWIPPGQRFWAMATGSGHLLAGIAIISGIQAALASRLLTAMLISFGILVWAPLLFASPGVHMMWAGNAINFALAGAAWVVADWIAAERTEPESARAVGEMA